MFKLRALFIHTICVHVDRQTGQGKARPLAAAAADTNSNNDDNIHNLMHNPNKQTQCILHAVRLQSYSIDLMGAFGGDSCAKRDHDLTMMTTVAHASILQTHG